MPKNSRKSGKSRRRRIVAAILAIIAIVTLCGWVDKVTQNVSWLHPDKIVNDVAIGSTAELERNPYPEIKIVGVVKDYVENEYKVQGDVHFTLPTGSANALITRYPDYHLEFLDRCGFSLSYTNSEGELVTRNWENCMEFPLDNGEKVDFYIINIDENR